MKPDKGSFNILCGPIVVNRSELYIDIISIELTCFSYLQFKVLNNVFTMLLLNLFIDGLDRIIAIRREV